MDSKILEPRGPGPLQVLGKIGKLFNGVTCPGLNIDSERV